jgi:hypothetical protein
MQCHVEAFPRGDDHGLEPPPLGGAATAGAAEDKAQTALPASRRATAARMDSPFHLRSAHAPRADYCRAKSAVKAKLPLPKRGGWMCAARSGTGLYAQ